MQKPQRITQLMYGAALAALCVVPSLGAQDRFEDRDRRDRRTDAESRLFTWRGVVDDEVRVAMRAGNIQSQLVSGVRVNNRTRVDRSNVLPRREGTVRVQLIEGRGSVQVIQQPDASNGFTTIVQIKDAQGGAAPYRFITYFDPATAVSRRGRQTEIFGGDVDLASGSPVFRWRGNVDGDIRITLRRGQVGYEVLAGEYPRNVSSTVLSGGLPARDARLALAPRQGRGNIAIVQQPSAANNYTAIITVRDTQGGFGTYDFDVIWR
jgi:hypothetical protein